MPKKDTKLQKLSENIYITLEEIRGLEIEDLDRIFMEEYLKQAVSLPIPASRRKYGILSKMW